MANLLLLSNRENPGYIRNPVRPGFCTSSIAFEAHFIGPKMASRPFKKAERPLGSHGLRYILPDGTIDPLKMGIPRSWAPCSALEMPSGTSESMKKMIKYGKTCRFPSESSGSTCTPRLERLLLSPLLDPLPLLSSLCGPLEEFHERVPQRGTFKCAYVCAPDERNWEYRKKLFECFALTELRVSEKEVSWWTNVHEAQRGLRHWTDI